MITPEFMDRFGALAFLYIIVFSIIELFGNVQTWMTVLLLIVGIIGLFVDLFMVFYFKRK